MTPYEAALVYARQAAGAPPTAAPPTAEVAAMLAVAYAVLHAAEAFTPMYSFAAARTPPIPLPGVVP